MLRKYIYSGIADFAPVLAGFISAMILTRRFGLEQWGLYSQVLWLVGISVVILSFGLTYGTTRYLAQFSGEKQLDELRRTIVFTGILQLVCSIIGAVTLFTLSEKFIYWFRWHSSPHLLRIAALGVLSLSLYQFSIFVLRGLQQFKKLAVYASIYALSILLISLFCIQWPMVELLLFATYGLQLLLLPWIWRYLVQITNMKKTENIFHLPRAWNGIVRFSLVIYLTLLVDQIVWQRSEIFFLAQLPDARQTGIYSLAYTVAFVVVGIIPSAITGVLTPVFTKVSSSKGIGQLRSSYQSNFTILNWFTLPVSIGLIVFSPILISDFFGDEYQSAGHILLLLILSSTVAIYSRPSASMLHALNLPKVLFISSLCALPVNLLLAWRFVPNFGAMGAAIANFTAQAIAGSIAIGYVSTRVRIKYDWKNLGQTMIGAILCGATAWLVMSIIPIPCLRLLVATLVGFVVYLIALLIMKDEIATYVLKKFLHILKTYIPQLSPGA